jgi:DNA-binding transcriptional LysR family regulator
MNWDDIRIFLSVARKGSLTGAAEVLGMSPSSTGRHIENLEARLGARLFIRSQNGYALSDAGLAIVPDAERAEGALDAVQRKAPGIAGEVSGTVRIAMPDNFANSLILPEIASFRHQHKDVLLEIVTNVNVVNLTRREADIGLRLVRPDSGNFVISRVGSMATALYAARSYLDEHPFDPTGRGNGHALIGWDEAFHTLRAATWPDEALPDASLVLKTTTLQSQLAACASGAGLAVLPCLMADPVPGLIRLREPETVFIQDIWLVTHQDIKETARIRVTLEFLRAVVQRNRNRLLGK